MKPQAMRRLADELEQLADELDERRPMLTDPGKWHANFMDSDAYLHAAFTLRRRASF